VDHAGKRTHSKNGGKSEVVMGGSSGSGARRGKVLGEGGERRQI